VSFVVNVAVHTILLLPDYMLYAFRSAIL